LGKTYGIKQGAIGNTLGEHIGNLMGELKGTCWNKGKMEKKKSRHFECMLSLPIGCMKFSMFQNWRSPFLAWANTPTHYKLGV